MTVLEREHLDGKPPAFMEVHGDVAHVVLNRPARRNALSMEMHHALNEIVSEITDNDEIVVLCLSGAGSTFCVGADIDSLLVELREASANRRKEMFQVSYQWIRKLLRLNIPIVTAVQGHAVGAGLSIALYGDYIVAADDAKFMAGFSRFGLIPDMGGLHLLPRAIGERRAQQLFLFNRMLEAHDALKWGLVDDVVPAAELGDAVQKVVDMCRDGPVSGRRFGKPALARSLARSLEQNLAAEISEQMKRLESHEFREAMDAWVRERSSEGRNV